MASPKGAIKTKHGIYVDECLDFVVVKMAVNTAIYEIMALMSHIFTTFDDIQ